ncbi:MAG TPA: TlpA disulfide reductase family protein [Kineosporiaceae bacterium]|nr:TlpA disulfide reductase family protein [Kineosporiaceae bacterium]
MGLRWRRTPVAGTSAGAARPAAGTAVLAAGLLLAAGGLAGCGGGSGGSDKGSGTSYVAGDGTVTIVAAKDRRQPVALSGKSIEGDLVDVAGFRGHPVVVNVWGSWCAPCRKEAPELQKAYTQLKAQGVAFIGIDTRDDDLAQARAFQTNFGITYPSIVDDGGAVLLGLRGVVAPTAVPTTLVLDEQGRVAARVSGGVNATTLIGLVHDAGAGTGSAG